MVSETYETAAAEVSGRLGIKVHIREGDGRCPEWSGGGKPRMRGICPKCGDIHGTHYRVTLSDRKGREFVTDYWHSYLESRQAVQDWHEAGGRSCGKPKPERGAPGVYDVLTCLVSDTGIPEEADEVEAEYGDMKPSRAYALAEAGRKVRRFFAFLTPEEMDELREVCQ